jgi:predicted nucleotide-binding protein (sugar kinase/HSP70/actin superfamily)
MYDFLWDFRQERRISDLESKAARAGEATTDAEYLIENFKSRIDKLVIVNMALWELLKEISDLTEEDLLKKVEEIDLSDGKLDGKVQKAVKQCPKCSRVINQKHNRCLYCGYQLPSEDGVFDQVIG